jgi:hypothetical protein
MRRSWQTRALLLASSWTRRHSSSCWNAAAQPLQPTLQLQMRPLGLLILVLLRPDSLPAAPHMQRRVQQPAAAAAALALLPGSAAQHPHSSPRPQPVHHNVQQAVQCRLGSSHSCWSRHSVSSCWDRSGTRAGRLR